MKNTTTGDIVDALILAAKQAEKARLIATLHPTGPNAKAVKTADRKVRQRKEELNRHFRQCIMEVNKSQRRKKA